MFIQQSAVNTVLIDPLYEHVALPTGRGDRVLADPGIRVGVGQDIVDPVTIVAGGRDDQPVHQQGAAVDGIDELRNRLLLVNLVRGQDLLALVALCARLVKVELVRSRGPIGRRQDVVDPMAVGAGGRGLVPLRAPDPVDAPCILLAHFRMALRAGALGLRVRRRAMIDGVTSVAVQASSGLCAFADWQLGVYAAEEATEAEVRIAFMALEAGRGDQRGMGGRGVVVHREDGVRITAVASQTARRARSDPLPLEMLLELLAVARRLERLGLVPVASRTADGWHLLRVWRLDSGMALVTVEIAVSGVFYQDDLLGLLLLPGVAVLTVLILSVGRAEAEGAQEH